MSEEIDKNGELKIVGANTSDAFEATQNLIGFFSILLDEARRTNPEKYINSYKKNK